MSDTLNLANSIWPNGMKVDSDGHAVFYSLGTNKVEVPTSSSEWPKGNKLVSPFVYQDDKLVGFCDTKAMTANSGTTIVMPYEHIEADFSAINKGQLQIHAPNATTKKASWKDSGVEDIPEAQFKYKGCKTIYDVKAVDSNYKTTDIVNGTWTELLCDLETGSNMFHTCSNLTDFTSDLSSLTDGYSMFYNCFNLTTFTSDLSSLTNGNYMFYYCSNLTDFTSDLSSLTDGYSMFYNCTNLTTFTSDLSSLTNGNSMFHTCSNLTTFTSDLGSLTNGTNMFFGCILDTVSVQNIANTIKDVNGLESNNYCSDGLKYIHIDIANSIPNEQEEAAFNTIASKGWTVYVNGVEYTSTSPAAITTLDENGEEITTPIPFWAKPVQTDEKHAKYIDSEGNFFNIIGAQFIYGDDISTYGMFTCEEDAAANMRLTPYTKPQTEIENQ